MKKATEEIVTDARIEAVALRILNERRLAHETTPGSANPTPETKALAWDTAVRAGDDGRSIFPMMTEASRDQWTARVRRVMRNAAKLGKVEEIPDPVRRNGSISWRVVW